jgi:uncharacterized repeat protein (TIGR03803 family)
MLNKMSCIRRILCLVSVLWLTSICATASDTLTVLHTLSGFDGQLPTGGLVFDSKGNLYGTASIGGTSSASCLNFSNCGTVFELSPVGGGGWTFQVIYSFTGGADGAVPGGDLVVDNLGNIYGTAQSGGTVNSNCSKGCGTVFELSPSGSSWTFTTLHSFSWSDGANPLGVIRDSRGRLYGTTYDGGSWSAGTVFELAGSNGVWNLSTLYTFGDSGNVAGGTYPSAGLTMDGHGNLYGTAFSGGYSSSGCYASCGTVFEISPGGKFTVLYKFLGSLHKDGANSEGKLVLDAAGDVFGTTAFGGTSCKGCNYGTVFKLSHSSGTWKEQVLHRFNGTDGQTPMGDLAIDSAGNLYGATNYGGTVCVNCGTVFTIKKNGSGFASLYSFTAGADGDDPFGGVTLNTAGDLFGTAGYGTAFGQGEVFELSPQ